MGTTAYKQGNSRGPTGITEGNLYRLCSKIEPLRGEKVKCLSNLSIWHVAAKTINADPKRRILRASVGDCAGSVAVLGSQPAFAALVIGALQVRGTMIVLPIP